MSTVVAILIVLVIVLFFGGSTAAAVLYGRYRLSPGYRSHQQLLNALGSLERQVAELEQALRRADQALEAAAREWEVKTKTAQLEAMSLEDLRAHGAKNVRWSAFEARGISNVRQLQQVLPYAESFDGVGATSAARLRTAVDQAIASVARRPVPLPDPMLETPGALELARATEARAVLRHTAEPVLRQLREVRSDLRDRSSALSTSFRDSVLATDEFRRSEAEADELTGILERRLESIPTNAIAAPRLSDQEIRRAFADNYADACAVIEPHFRGNARRHSARGNLADDIAAGVEAFPLDTSGLDVTLRKYQAFGASFMLARKRTILGDEMGLGKTIETLGAFSHLASRGKTHFLVVSPAGLIFNWKNETINRTNLQPTLLYGNSRDAAIQRWARDGGVGITSYATLRMILPVLQQTGRKIDMAVFDEAHYVKNPDAQRSKATRQVVEQAEFACLLTGTPMENKPSEFANLIAMVSPDVARSVRIGSDSVVDADRFRRRVAEVYLRRNQRDVLTELPETIEHEDWVQLNSSDVTAYVEAVRDKHWHRMRQASIVGDGVHISAKLERLAELFETYRDEGRKIVVFSYYHSVLDALMARWPGVVMGPLTGKLTPAAREELVAAFRNRPGFAVLASQIQAGGVGLNMQFASVVVLMEPQLKPTTEDQAIARLRRMGQIRSVMVHRILAERTLEEDILEILGRKRRHFDAYARDSLAKAMSPKATERDMLTAIIERQTLRLQLDGLLRGDVRPAEVVPEPAPSAHSSPEPPRAPQRPLREFQTPVPEPNIEQDPARAFHLPPNNSTNPKAAQPVPSPTAPPAPATADEWDAPTEAVQVGSALLRLMDAPREHPRPNASMPEPPSPPVQSQHETTAPELIQPPPPSTPAEPPAWLAALLERLGPSLTQSRLDSDKVAVLLTVLADNGNRSNVAALAESLDLNVPRCHRFVTTVAAALNRGDEYLAYDRSDGLVMLELDRLCARNGISPPS